MYSNYPCILIRDKARIPVPCGPRGHWFCHCSAPVRKLEHGRTSFREGRGFRLVRGPRVRGLRSAPLPLIGPNCRLTRFAHSPPRLRALIWASSEHAWGLPDTYDLPGSDDKSKLLKPTPIRGCYILMVISLVRHSRPRREELLTCHLSRHHPYSKSALGSNIILLSKS